jgi:hypothetical protein
MGLFACRLIAWFSCQPCCHALEGVPGIRMPDADPSISELEHGLFSMLNRDRGRRGLPPLLLDSSLTRIARDHSGKMAARGILGHDLPPSGDLNARLSRAGYLVRTARENVARAGSIDQAETALLKSPGHLRNIVAADVSHVGVGIARGAASREGDLYITQIFADPATPPQPAQLRSAQLARIEEARRNSGLRPLRVDPLFDKVAARLLDSLEFPFKAGDLEHLLDDAARQIPQGAVKDVSRMSVDTQLVRDVRDLKISDELRRARASVLGTASRKFCDSRGQPVVAILTLIGSR